MRLSLHVHECLPAHGRPSVRVRVPTRGDAESQGRGGRSACTTWCGGSVCAVQERKGTKGPLCHIPSSSPPFR